MNFKFSKIQKLKKTFIIAEIGINHNGNFHKCKEMIFAAAKSGADAVKLQTINIDESYHTSSKSYKVFKGKDFSGYQLKRLKIYAEKKGILFFSTPGDLSSLNKLLSIKIKMIKISSGLINNIPLIEKALKSKLPVIFSTGMARRHDIEYLIKTSKKFKNSNIALMKCTSLYPPRDSQLNLNAIETIKKKYKLTPGYSDHSIDILAPTIAVAKGALIIEKHFKLKENDRCPDQKISLSPTKFKKMVENIRRVEKMLGNYKVECNDKEILEKRQKNLRYIFSKKKINIGEKISISNIAFKRSEIKKKKLEPKFISKILNKKVKRMIPKNTIINLRDIHVK